MDEEVLSLMLAKSKLDILLGISTNQMKEDDHLAMYNFTAYRTMAMVADKKLDIDDYIAMNNEAWHEGFLHKHDTGMITRADLDWFNALSGTEEIAQIFETDHIFREGAFASEIKGGLDSKSASLKVVEAYPFFYINTEDRFEMPHMGEDSIPYTDDDMRLPFFIKNRVNRFTSSLFLSVRFGIKRKESLTFNAFIRRMLREGKL